jgi:hypothetical protein
VQLREVQPDLPRNSQDLRWFFIDEDTNPDNVFRQRDGNSASLLNADAPRALGEDEPDGVGARVPHHAGGPRVRNPAYLYQRHKAKCTPYLWRREPKARNRPRGSLNIS